MKKLLIFDFDGVILDTEKYHYLAWREAFLEVGVEISWEDYLPLKSTGRDFTVNSIANSRNLNFSESEMEKLKERKGECYQAISGRISKSDMIAGVIEFLDSAHASGIKMAVASSSKMAETTIEKFGLSKYFTLIADGNLGLAPKPNPDIFLFCSEKLGFQPSDCVVFEDSIVGLQAGKNAEMKCVQIGENPNENANLTKSDFKNISLCEIQNL